MYNWIKAYLHNRKARVSVNNILSKKILLRHGVPQGGVLSPSLFLLFINDLVDDLPKGIKAALYADDLVLWCTEEHSSTATYRMQQAADKLHEWALRWCVSINKEKSSSTLFTLSTKQKAGIIKIGDTPLRNDSEPTYLGVTFDQRLTWKPQLAKAEGKARRKLAILRKLSGTTWGANHKILKTVYQGSVRPHLEYSSTAWSTAAKANLNTLDKVQNQALRIMTGAMKSTPIRAMEQISGITPLQQRREEKIMIQATKYNCLPKHPMKQKLEGLTKNRLKRRSFLHESKRLFRQHQNSLPKNNIPLDPGKFSKPWEQDRVNLEINTTVPQITSGECQSETAKKALAMAMIQENYPEEAWIHVYTDGSAINAVTNGGAGILIKYPGGNFDTNSLPTGKHCTNYKAEMDALMQAITMVRDTEDTCEQVVIFTDALSVLQALENGKCPDLTEALQELCRRRKTILQWIPAHCGICGNERADELAKLGSKKPQSENAVTYSEKRSLIRALHRQPKERDDYHLLSRDQQVILMRLRTGHNRLKKHLNRLKISASPVCPCGQEDQTSEHVLQRYPQLQKLRKKM